MYSKNDIVKISITDMTTEGIGIGKLDGIVFFVKNALIDDEVEAIVTKVTNNIIYAKAKNFIKKSKYRVDSKCSISDSCGGCTLLKLDYDKQLEIKEAIVKSNLEKIAGLDKNYIEEKYEGIVGIEKKDGFRNKMQIPFSCKNGKIVAGFYASRTHYIIECERCINGFDGAFDIVNLVKKYLINNRISIYDEITGKGLFRELMLRKANNTREVSITFIVNDKNYNKNEKMYKDLSNYVVNGIKNLKVVTTSVNINIDKNNVLFGKENHILYGNGYIEDIINGLKFHISPESFYQVNNIQTEKLYNEALSFLDLKGNEIALDLFCGIGTITLNLAKKVKNIIGIEIVDKAVKNAKENAKLNNISNAIFKCIDVNELINEVSLYKNIDVITVDPPRKGLSIETIKFIKNICPLKILYISCDSATLSRDLKLLLSENEYVIDRIKSVDMFPHTMHVECVVLMSRIK